MNYLQIFKRRTGFVGSTNYLEINTNDNANRLQIAGRAGRWPEDTTLSRYETFDIAFKIKLT